MTGSAASTPCGSAVLGVLCHLFFIISSAVNILFIKERGGVRGGGQLGSGPPDGPERITGSDLCFSIRSVLLVVEPTGGKQEERGVPGGEEG